MITDKNALTEQHSFRFGRRRIDFILTLSERKSLKIDVHPDKTIAVFAPINTEKKSILSRIKKRAPWIIKQQNYFDQFHPLPVKRQYVSGETHLYLGRQYRLKVIKNNREVVKLVGRYFNIYTRSPANKDKVGQLLNEWYKSHGRVIFDQRLAICYEGVKRMQVPYPEIQLRRMKKRWGSCDKSGNILLNTELVKVPLYCIDYVILHELCHLKVHNHDNRYFRLLSKYMPDWERRKVRLEKFII